MYSSILKETGKPKMEGLIIFLDMRSANADGPQYEALWAFSPAEEKIAFETAHRHDY